MRRLGINGVPALILDDEQGRRLLPSNMLFGSFELLTKHLRAA